MSKEDVFVVAKQKAEEHLEMFYGDPLSEKINYIDFEDAVDVALNHVKKEFPKNLFIKKIQNNEVTLRECKCKEKNEKIKQLKEELDLIYRQRDRLRLEKNDLKKELQEELLKE